MFRFPELAGRAIVNFVWSWKYIVFNRDFRWICTTFYVKGIYNSFTVSIPLRFIWVVYRYYYTHFLGSSFGLSSCAKLYEGDVFLGFSCDSTRASRGAGGVVPGFHVRLGSTENVAVVPTNGYTTACMPLSVTRNSCLNCPVSSSNPVSSGAIGTNMQFIMVAVSSSGSTSSNISSKCFMITGISAFIGDATHVAEDI